AGDKVPADIKTGVEGKISALKGVKDGQDMDAIKKATEELSNELQKIGQYMNQQTQTPPAGDTAAGAQGSAEGANPAGDGPVRDADFEENKDNPENK
ncbi:MAG: chaperone protein DnaK, molecular chaperone DnaK, partial [Gammaproteobacteria bacterium]|nr:chaperone protein DnaK, molecular chaperone DnaK [Gammaproteobacteria bacterium]